jgi:UDP-N-acetyl-D-galactosamine dehydrogenase
MGKHVATEVVKCMMRKDLKVLEANVLMLGITFKENCPDIRNTRAIDIYKELKTYDMQVDVFDPWADPEEVHEEYGLNLLSGDKAPELSDYSAIILAVSHEKFRNLPIQKSDNCVVFDVKSFLDKNVVDKRL